MVPAAFSEWNAPLYSSPVGNFKNYPSYWYVVIQPYMKNRGVTLCPSLKVNYGSPTWFSCLDNIDVTCKNAKCSACDAVARVSSCQYLPWMIAV